MNANDPRPPKRICKPNIGRSYHIEATQEYINSRPRPIPFDPLNDIDLADEINLALADLDEAISQIEAPSIAYREECIARSYGPERAGSTSLSCCTTRGCTIYFSPARRRRASTIAAP